MTAPRTTADCEHRFITTYGSAGSDGSYEVTMWGCQECERRFYPACPECIVNGHRGGKHEPTGDLALVPAAAPLRAEDHKPRWSQDRDDPVGMWVCGCDKTFAPDDFEGYWRHLGAVPVEAAALERLVE